MVEINESADKAVARLLEIVGGILAGGAVAAMLTQGASVFAALVIGLFGLLLLLIGVFWRWVKPFLGERLVASMQAKATNFGTWLTIAFLGWVSLVAMFVSREIRVANELSLLRNDTQSIARVLERTVLPRKLSSDQQQAISGFLRQFDPYEVSFVLQERDEEVGSYRADIHQALLKAGWKVREITYRSDVQEGVRIHFMQTMEHSQQANDPRNPSPGLLLQMALGNAGVRLNGTGGGSGINVTEDKLTIYIGRRRRDLYEIVPPEER